MNEKRVAAETALSSANSPAADIEHDIDYLATMIDACGTARAYAEICALILAAGDKLERLTPGSPALPLLADAYAALLPLVSARAGIGRPDPKTMDETIRRYLPEAE